MTAPRYADCRCGHPKTRHEEPGFDDQCIASGCTCLRYRPSTAAPSKPQPVRAHTPPTNTLGTTQVTVMTEPTAEQVIAAGKRSASKRIVSLAEKCEAMVGDLRQRLADERIAAEQERKAEERRRQARAEVERLEKQLADAKAKLRPSGAAKPRAATGDGKCPDCGKDGLSNVGVHRAKAHGYRVEAAS